MIRYPVGRDALLEAIEAEKPGWIERARQRTDAFRAAAKYDESSGIWSAIKNVFRGFQAQKCAFCERQLAGAPFGAIDHDVEHYRPKNSVRKWPPPNRELSYDFETGEEMENGYYLLAYSVFNYVTACKVCNTPLKSNYFPIADRRGSATEEDPRRLASERPFLPFPLGDTDDDPEELIAFDGILAVPSTPDLESHEWRRAAVTIDFFALNEREELRLQRAALLKGTYLALQLRDHDDDVTRETARQWLADIDTPGQPHANCLRSFVRLYSADREHAIEIIRELNRAFPRS
jgi:hypothetical protein